MLNHIIIMGRLTRDPEFRATSTGVSVTSFCVAVDRDYSANSEKETDFIECVAWRKTAEFVTKHFTKGKQIVVSGRLQIRSWTDKDGNKRKTAEVIAENVYFCGSKSDTGQTTGKPTFVPYEAPIGEAFPETAAYMNTLSQQQDFVMLEGDDAQLPF